MIGKGCLWFMHCKIFFEKKFSFKNKIIFIDILFDRQLSTRNLTKIGRNIAENNLGKVSTINNINNQGPDTKNYHRSMIKSRTISQIYLRDIGTIWYMMSYSTKSYGSFEYPGSVEQIIFSAKCLFIVVVEGSGKKQRSSNKRPVIASSIHNL